MKIHLTILLLFALALCSYANVLSPKGPKAEFSLKNSFILIPANPTEKEKEAGLDLQKYINQVFSTNIELITEDKLHTNHFISLGNTKSFQMTGINNNLKDDGYGLATKDNNLYIYGKDIKGVTNGIFCLLEEDLGCRFWDRYDNETIPTIKGNSIIFVPRTYNPPFTIRHSYQDETTGYNYERKNKIVEYIIGCHSSFNYVSPDNFKEHPQWFCETNGERQPYQLCYSNPEVIQKITDEIRKSLRENYREQVPFSPQDGYPLCDCEECNKIDKPEGTKAGAFYKAVNQVCENLRDEFPNVKIVTLAYLDYVTPMKSFKPDKNIIVTVCSDDCDWKNPFLTYEETSRFKNDVLAWKDAGANIVTWNYVCNYDHYIIPTPNDRVIANNLKYLRDYKVNGVFLQGGPAGFRDMGNIKSWVWSHLLWNPDLDVMALNKEFIYGYYGNSAPYIWEYEKLLDKLYTDNHKKLKIHRDKPYNTGENPLLVDGIRWGCFERLYTDEFVNKGTDFIEKALLAADSEEVKNRVLRIKIDMDYLILGRSIGYRQVTGQYNHQDFDKTKIDYYNSLIDEIDYVSNLTGADRYAEIYTSGIKDLYLNKWRDVLSTDTSKFEQTKLSAPWLFKTDPTDTADYSNSDTKDWIEMPVEKIWENIIGPYDGTAWYTREENFTPETLAKKGIYLLFQAVDEESTVYINGQKVYEHTVDSTGLPTETLWTKSFIVNIKDYLKEGTNKITVKVHDKMNAGGIYSPVYIITTNEDITEQEILKCFE